VADSRPSSSATLPPSPPFIIIGPMSVSGKKRILALDMGEKRIGVALSDAEARLASPLMVLPKRGRDENVRAIDELVTTHQAGLIVLGLPRKSESELGPAAEAIQRFGNRLEKALKIQVVFVDEFETTVRAQEALLEADLSRVKRREKVDKVAAALILEAYLTSSKERS
jgi:putative Holliday junction resolvase